MCNERGGVGRLAADEESSRDILEAFKNEALSQKCRAGLWRQFKKIAQKEGGDAWPIYEHIGYFINSATAGYPVRRAMIAVALDGLRLFKKLYGNSHNFVGLIDQCNLLPKSGDNSVVRKAKLELLQFAIRMPVTSSQMKWHEESLNYVLDDDEIDPEAREYAWNVLKQLWSKPQKSRLSQDEIWSELRGVYSDRDLPMQVKMEAFEMHLRARPQDIGRFAAPWYAPHSRVPRRLMKKMKELETEMDKRLK